MDAPRSCRRLLGLAGSFTMLAILGGCGGTGPADVQSGAFVGASSESTGVIVAVNARPPDTNSPYRIVDAYVTDGATVSKFFTGEVLGDVFELNSTTNDAEISGTVDATGVSGVLRLGTEPILSFQLEKATGTAGLYSVFISRETNTLSGTSSLSTVLTGVLAPPSGGEIAVTGTLRPSGAGGVEFDAILTDESDGRQEWIILLSGAIVGGFYPGAGQGFAMGS